MRDLTYPDVEEPERFFPEPEIVVEPEVRVLDDGYGELWLHDKGEWERIHPVFVEIIEALKRGLPFEQLVEEVPYFPEDRITSDRRIEKVARGFIWKLNKRGFVDLQLPDPPDVFNDRYRRIEELGRGGLGVAHLCEDLEADGRRVVVKHPWGVKASISGAQKTLAREIQAYQNIHHPNVPTMHETFQVRGLLHMARDYVEGTKLSRLTRRQLTEDRPKRLEKVRHVARALGRFHEQGALFLDIAPGNFMFDGDELWISDLGSVTFWDDGVVTLRGPRGTAGYVAHELRHRRSGGKVYATVRSDVFSLGRLYYYLTHGSRPSRGWNMEEIGEEMADRDAPQEDREIVQTLCHDDPDQRPASMGEALEVLK